MVMTLELYSQCVVQESDSRLRTENLPLTAVNPLHSSATLVCTGIEFNLGSLIHCISLFG